MQFRPSTKCHFTISTSTKDTKQNAIEISPILYVLDNVCQKGITSGHKAIGNFFLIFMGKINI